MTKEELVSRVMDLVDTVNGLVINIFQAKEIIEKQDGFINTLKSHMLRGETMFYYALQEQFPILINDIKTMQVKHQYEKTQIHPEGILRVKSIEEVREKFGLNDEKNR